MIAVKVSKKFESNLAMACIDAICRSWVSYLYCTVCDKVNVKRDFGTLLQDFIVSCVFLYFRSLPSGDCARSMYAHAGHWSGPHAQQPHSHHTPTTAFTQCTTFPGLKCAFDL